MPTGVRLVGQGKRSQVSPSHSIADPDAAGSPGGMSVGAPVAQMKVHDVRFSSRKGVPLFVNAGGGAETQVSIARVSLDGTRKSRDINVLNAAATAVQPLYDVAQGLSVGAGAIVSSWPPYERPLRPPAG